MRHLLRWNGVTNYLIFSSWDLDNNKSLKHCNERGAMDQWPETMSIVSGWPSPRKVMRQSYRTNQYTFIQALGLLFFGFCCSLYSCSYRCGTANPSTNLVTRNDENNTSLEHTNTQTTLHIWAMPITQLLVSYLGFAIEMYMEILAQLFGYSTRIFYAANNVTSSSHNMTHILTRESFHMGWWLAVDKIIYTRFEVTNPGVLAYRLWAVEVNQINGLAWIL